MPNAKCDKCKQELDNICINDEQKILLINLLEERAKRRFGIIYNIDPGIRHNEISPTNTSLNGNNCDGIIWYNHFSKNPKGFEEIDFSKIIFNSQNTNEIKKNLLKNIHVKINNGEKINNEKNINNGKKIYNGKKIILQTSDCDDLISDIYIFYVIFFIFCCIIFKILHLSTLLVLV